MARDETLFEKIKELEKRISKLEEKDLLETRFYGGMQWVGCVGHNHHYRSQPVHTIKDVLNAILGHLGVTLSKSERVPEVPSETLLVPIEATITED